MSRETPKLSPKLSIVTAIHNALPMNQLYWEMLVENTTSPFELIVVDNHSTDGSENFFAQLAADSAADARPYRVVHLRNETNQSYPSSQNQGIRAARGEVLCFLNNDIWMAPDWNRPFEEALAENPLLVLSPSGQEAQPTQRDSDRLKLRWRRITAASKIWRRVLGKSEKERLWWSLRRMYGDLDTFRSPTRVGENGWMHGIKGDVVVFHRALLDRVGGIWDERIQAADWHLYLTLARHHENDPEIPLPRILLNVYAHHFGRYSARQKFEPLPNAGDLLPLEALWDAETIRRLWWGEYR